MEPGMTPEERTGLVDAAVLEHELAVLSAAAPGGEIGLFGPRSLLWRVDREAALFLGAGRALLLQLAHPWIAAAIAEHSLSLADPIGRFHRTFGTVFTMVFGTVDQALAAARRLHRRHAGITGRLTEEAGCFAAGSPYAANDRAALAWVHATLVDTALRAWDLVLPPLTAAEREQYYAETRQFGRLFGIPPEDGPSCWADFAAYVDAMIASETLCVSDAARDIARLLLSGDGTWLRVPTWYRAVTAMLLPPRLRAAFGFAYGESEQRRAQCALAWLRRAYPLLPGSLRCVGPYQEAARRLAGRPPGAAAALANRFWIGAIKMP
jgi:uncharacterized protein (DUF2236 family)